MKSSSGLMLDLLESVGGSEEVIRRAQADVRDLALSGRRVELEAIHGKENDQRLAAV